MPEKIENLSYSMRRQFDEIIDVRSPSEFAEDHVPGAINLPVLNDDERHEVGSIYCQHSRHEARRLGARYVTQNVSNYLGEYFATKSADYQPLIYCWRGGLRSQSLASILSGVGWYSKIIGGGYRSWRQNVVQALREKELHHSFILIDGQTGTHKTKLLSMLGERNYQTLDLEYLAKHRGSVFGSLGDVKQPSQKYFESLIYDQLCRFNPKEPVFVEAESPKIGRRALPTSVINRMRRSPRIELRASATVRAQNLIQCYADLVNSPQKIYAALEYLRPYHAANKIRHWQALTAKECFEDLAFELIQAHYDPCYERQRAKRCDEAASVIELSALNESTLDAAVDEIIHLSTALITTHQAAHKHTTQELPA